MVANIVFILALVVSGTCISHSMMADSPDMGSRPMWSFDPSSRLYGFMKIGGNIASLGWIPTVIWGFMHIRWYWVLLALIVSFPLTHSFERRIPFAPMLAIVAALPLCIALWFLN